MLNQENQRLKEHTGKIPPAVQRASENIKDSSYTVIVVGNNQVYHFKE